MATDREKLEHLLAGGLLASAGMYKRLKGDSIVWTMPNLPEDSTYETAIGIINFDESEIYIEPKWWDNIPLEGILCKVWDGKLENAIYRTVFEYRPIDKKFRAVSLWYENAIPLNEEQLSAYELLKSIGT